MRIIGIPEDETTKMPLLNKVILVVRKQPDATISDYIACIKENGELADKGETLISDDSKETETIPPRDWIKKGIAVGLSTLLLTTALGVKQRTHETVKIPADRASEESVSDIELLELGGQYIQYTGTVYKDPGVLIHDMRDLALGEDLLITESRDEYLKNTTGESRAEEEANILAISTQFHEQQRIIFENEQILKSSAPESKKIEALSKIITAKSSIQKLYLDNKELYDSYVRLAQQAHDRFGGDERSEQEDEVADYDGLQFDTSIYNLSVDISSLSDSLYVISNPRELFDEQPAPKGTTESVYMVDTELFGHDIQLGEISSTEVKDIDYRTTITAEQKGETITSGTVVIDGKAIQRTETTRNGLFAISNITKKMIDGEELGEVTLFGKTIVDDPHIDDNNR